MSAVSLFDDSFNVESKNDRSSEIEGINSSYLKDAKVRETDEWLEAALSGGLIMTQQRGVDRLPVLSNSPHQTFTELTSTDVFLGFPLTREPKKQESDNLSITKYEPKLLNAKTDPLDPVPFPFPVPVSVQYLKAMQPENHAMVEEPKAAGVVSEVTTSKRTDSPVRLNSDFFGLRKLTKYEKEQECDDFLRDLRERDQVSPHNTETTHSPLEFPRKNPHR